MPDAIPVYSSRGEYFISQREAARAMNCQPNHIWVAVQSGIRHACRHWSSRPFGDDQITHLGEDEPGRYYKPCYSSDGRAWVNASYAAEKLGVSKSSIHDAIGFHRKCLGLRWSRTPYPNTRQTPEVKTEGDDHE
jgi:hypothetical protein